MIRWLVLAASHMAVLGLGFALGVYLLPVLTAPHGPDASLVQAVAQSAAFKGAFRRDLKGSDFLHWGEGEVSVARDRIAHVGRLAPGPDYKLYLAPAFVDTKEAFLALKGQAVRLGDVKTFEGFVLDVPPGLDVARFNTVVVWCEAFSQFISAAKYR